MIRYEILKVVEIFRIVDIERKWKNEEVRKRIECGGREEESGGKNKGQKRGEGGGRNVEKGTTGVDGEEKGWKDFEKKKKKKR